MSIDQDIANSSKILEQDVEINHQITHGNDTTEVPTEGGPVPTIAKRLRDIETEWSQQADPLAQELSDTVDITKGYKAEAAVSASSAQDSASSAQDSATQSAEELPKVQAAGEEQVDTIIATGDAQDTRVQEEGAFQSGNVQQTGNEQQNRVVAEGNEQQNRVVAEGNEQQQQIVDEGNIQVTRAAVEADRAEEIANEFGDVDGAIDEATRQADRSTSQADRATDQTIMAEAALSETEKARDDAVAVVYEGDASLEPKSGCIPIGDSNAKIHKGWLPVDSAVPAPDFHWPLINDLTIAQGIGTPYQIDVSQDQDGSVMVDLPIYRGEFRRPCKKTYTDKSGKIVEAEVNEPAFGIGGIFPEGIGTNDLFLADNDFDLNPGAEYAQASLRNKLVFNKFQGWEVHDIDDSGNEYHLRALNIYLYKDTGKTYFTFSFVVKHESEIKVGISKFSGSESQTASIDIQPEGSYTIQNASFTISNVDIEPMADGYRRVSGLFTFVEGTNYAGSINIRSRGFIHIGGFQAEYDIKSSSYIPAIDSPTTRIADRLSIDNRVFPASITGFTIAIELQKIVNLSDWFSIYSSSGSNVLSYGQTGNGVQGSTTAYGTSIYPSTSAGLHDSPVILCVTVTKNTCTVFLNGVIRGIDNNPGVTSEPVTGDLVIGGHKTNSSRACWTNIRNLRIWNSILSPEQIANL